MKHLIGLFVVIAFILQIILAAPVSENAVADSSHALKHFQGVSFDIIFFPILFPPSIF